jgi:hypothetical protein
MAIPSRDCPDCNQPTAAVTRRDFIRTTAGAAAVVAAAGLPAVTRAAEGESTSAPETIVKSLYESLSDAQKKQVAFEWDFVAPQRGLLRTHVENNWSITEPIINSEFYTSDQKEMIRKIFEGIVQPDWHKRIYKQLEDDAGGFGNSQNIAIFGKPGEKFEFVMTGRHLTMRCDGNSTEHVAFGGPIFYGHAASGFNEKPNHPGNVFWHQALAANKVYEMLDQKQRDRALVESLPVEEEVSFRGPQGAFPGLPVAEMSSDQRSLVQEVLQKLVEPYRQSDRDEVVKCLEKQGGLEKCALAFYREKDLGGDKVWDCWRLEGPSFVWYYRGAPHVHVWVNVADDASVKTNTRALI